MIHVRRFLLGLIPVAIFFLYIKLDAITAWIGSLLPDIFWQCLGLGILGITIVCLVYMFGLAIEEWWNAESDLEASPMRGKEGIGGEAVD